ncbi:MAG: sigma-70 family RNA polymerase sigma factor [Muribaculaceae bacterium]|nr:sigma-70 family RNA polymerase sigma factor [Muribaculaceae bacterium]
MNEYLQIVTRWYEELHDPFHNILAQRFTSLSDDDIEDLYQETFLAVHDNLHQGRVAPVTNWKAYILRIGMNQATTLAKSRKNIVSLDANDDDDERPSTLFEQFASLLDILSETTDDPAELEQHITKLNDILDRLKDPCSTLLRDFYYNDMSLAEIRDEMGYSNTDVVKTKRYRCFQRLKQAVMEALDNGLWTNDNG